MGVFVFNHAEIPETPHAHLGFMKIAFVLEGDYSGNEEVFLEMGYLGPGATPQEIDDVKARFQTVSLPGEAGALWRPQDA